MANYLVRWWKTKFLSGYKQFTGVEEDADDTGIENPSTTKLKELSCDVSLKDGTNTNGKDRLQEFSFTLYDFDGHGKVTKDDIASLVTTIYETLGSSLKVPHYGSKTIKVKLTVSPNVEKVETKKSESNSHTTNTKGYKKDFNVTIRERKNSKCKDNDTNQQTTPQFVPVLNCAGCSRNNKKRSSSLQRQQLLKIIQANMEKNNLPFKTSRPSHIWNQDKEKPPRCHQWRGGQESIGRHHQKHRHREAEQARAMAQVVRWLEQEFSSPKQDHGQYIPTNECLEHRHIHEHVHHHYHHYQDPPISI